MAAPDNTLSVLQLLNARSISLAASSGPIAAGIHKLAGAGVIPGALVFDSVTGQVVEVLAVGVVYLPAAAAEGGNSGS